MLHLKKPIPNHIANKNIIVECLREQVTNFNDALLLYPEDPYLINRRAMSYIETLFGNLNQALEYAHLALVIDNSDYKNIFRQELPNETYMYQNLGYLYYQMSKYDLALEALNNAERLLPGQLLNFQNKVARSPIEIQVNNHDVIPIVERGLLYHSMGKDYLATDEMVKAMTIKPIQQDRWHTLAEFEGERLIFD
ncbi:hypothetical protein C1645_834568 [Glomus cerebriforme]|uniref:Uncharacterized protein n=1 Tax=Glomus cerebriforme TaxID=658196 RepID=A0A397SG51_9GLOM|nr:hypothetical protein C1645_834568 [Glomus cerebriforme]